MNTNDFDFLHHLQDTLTLLGGSKEARGKIEKLMDGGITEADIDDLRRYNIILFTEVKSRLASLHTIKIAPASEP